MVLDERLLLESARFVPCSHSRPGKLYSAVRSDASREPSDTAKTSSSGRSEGGVVKNIYTHIITRTTQARATNTAVNNTDTANGEQDTPYVFPEGSGRWKPPDYQAMVDELHRLSRAGQFEKGGETWEFAEQIYNQAVAKSNRALPAS